MIHFRRWGVVSFADSLDCVGIVSKDVTSASKVFGSFLPAPFYQEFYIHRRHRQDALSVFDENDPTAARPPTREKARASCSEHMTEWASSNLRDLTKLRIGIPQVCPLTVTRSLFDLKITGYGIGVLSDFSQ